MKTHKDYLSDIGRTTETYNTLREKRWNSVYYMARKLALDCMLVDGDMILDVGTSIGTWLSYFQNEGFSRVWGVELDFGRVKAACQRGYDLVFNCDATNIPIASQSVEQAVSSGVFVHILRRNDKIAVLKEMERILIPGGVFVFDQTMSRAFGFDEYTVQGSNSFMRLGEVVSLVQENTDFRLIDIQPTYFHFRNQKNRLLISVLRNMMRLPIPLMPQIMNILNITTARKIPLEYSDSVYFKLVIEK